MSDFSLFFAFYLESDYTWDMQDIFRSVLKTPEIGADLVVQQELETLFVQLQENIESDDMQTISTTIQDLEGKVDALGLSAESRSVYDQYKKELAMQLVTKNKNIADAAAQQQTDLGSLESSVQQKNTAVKKAGIRSGLWSLWGRASWKLKNIRESGSGIRKMLAGIWKKVSASAKSLREKVAKNALWFMSIVWLDNWSVKILERLHLAVVTWEAATILDPEVKAETELEEQGETELEWEVAEVIDPDLDQIKRGIVDWLSKEELLTKIWITSRIPFEAREWWYSLNEFVSLILPLANEIRSKYGIPVSIILAQAIKESGRGSNTHSREHFNFMAIKAHRYRKWRTFGAVDDDTDTAWNLIKSGFRSYESIEHGFYDYAQFLKYQNTLYRSLFDLETTDYAWWAKWLKKAGYASDPNYATGLIAVIEENNLNQYDF